MDLQECVNRLQALGLNARVIGSGARSTILGASKIQYASDGRGIEHAEDPFIIFFEDGYWRAELSGPGQMSTTVAKSGDIDEACNALISFFRMSKKQATLPATALRKLLWQLQEKGWNTHIISDVEILVVQSGYTEFQPEARSGAIEYFALKLEKDKWSLVKHHQSALQQLHISSNLAELVDKILNDN